jgi:glycosyltransferase involved in cell wall biosynthesis
MEGEWALWHGVRYTQARGWSTPEASPSRIRRISRGIAAMRADGPRTSALIDKLKCEGGVDVVIGYSMYQIGMSRIMAHCKSAGIPLVNDVVEWCGPDSFAAGRLNPLYWDSVRAFRTLLPRSDGIIAISSFLERWFGAKRIPTLRVPAIIDTKVGDAAVVDTAVTDATKARVGKDIARATPNEPFVLTYLGNMIDRDGPMLMIDAVRRVAAGGHEVVFNVVGRTARIRSAQRAKAVAESDPLLRDRVRFWGGVADEDVQRHLHASDALIFTRLSSRASQAAFPTRLPEYLVTGRPVIASDVSDIGEYLIDGKEALIIEPDSSASLAKAIVRLMELPDRGRAIGLAGRAKCAACFDYGARVEEIVEFLRDEILSPRRAAAARHASPAPPATA